MKAYGIYAGDKDPRKRRYMLRGERIWLRREDAEVRFGRISEIHPWSAFFVVVLGKTDEYEARRYRVAGEFTLFARARILNKRFLTSEQRLVLRVEDTLEKPASSGLLFMPSVVT